MPTPLPEAEILAQIRQIQADLFPALPPEIQMAAQDLAAIQIRIHLLRARLEMSPEEEQTPLSLARLLALLVELVGHTDEASRLSAAPLPTADSDAVLRAMRAAVLVGEVPALRALLEQERSIYASVSKGPATPPSEDGE